MEASVSFVSSSGEGCTVFAEPVETIIVGYQRFSLDYDLPDGTYTPQELQRAKLLVKPGGVFRYRLRWPAGRPQPIADQDRRSGNQEGTWR